MKATLRYPLSTLTRAGVENLKRLGLSTELSTAPSPEELTTFRDFAISGHAPLYNGDLLLNIGAIDEEFRQMSIDELLSYVDLVRKLPRLRQVNMHPGPKQWLNDTQTGGRHGDYGRMIDGIREIADAAARWGIEIVLENNRAYWDDVADEVPPDQVDWTDRNLAFGAAPDEWIQICEDVGRPNVGLCLDSNHTCTYAHTFEPDRRVDVVMAYVSRPELIRHVHWSDNHLYDARGRRGPDAMLGTGSLPLELHRAIKGLDATILIERFTTIEDLEEELHFIDRL